MSAQMFGAPIGESQALSDIRQQELANMSLAEGSVKLEQAQVNLDNQKQMMAIMQQGTMGNGSGQSPSGPSSNAPSAGNDQSYNLATMMDKLAVMAATSGMPEKAREYATAGSTLRHQASQIADTEFKETIKHLDYIGTLMEGVHDEATWRQANAMYQLTMGKPTPYSQLPYNPRVVEELKQGVSSAKDRATTSAAKARQAASEAATAEREARIPLIKAQTRLADTREQHLRKAGAVGLVPKAEDVKAVTDLITKEYPSVMPEDARVRARPVAEEALRLMKQTNLSRSEAANRAYQNAKAAGAFGGLQPGIQRSGSMDKPLDLPADYSKLKANMFYKGKGAYANKTLLWTGSSFVPVGKGPGEISPTADEEISEGGEPGDETEEELTPDDVAPAE